MDPPEATGVVHEEINIYIIEEWPQQPPPIPMGETPPRRLQKWMPPKAASNRPVTSVSRGAYASDNKVNKHRSLRHVPGPPGCLLATPSQSSCHEVTSHLGYSLRTLIEPQAENNTYLRIPAVGTQ